MAAFHFQDGYLYCENVQLKQLIGDAAEVLHKTSPLFVYSLNQIKENVKSYLEALQPLNDKGVLTTVAYSVKANYNPHILKILLNLGCSVTLVSGQELELALNLGFSTDNMIYNGNGKERNEIELAITSGCIINVDSDSDLKRICESAFQLNKKARVIFRVNPNIDPKVHPYIATGIKNTKFGLDEANLRHLWQRVLKEMKCGNIEILGFHCHVGSSVEDMQVFRDTSDFLVKLINSDQYKITEKCRYINIGGGLGIDYTHTNSTPSVTDLVSSLSEKLEGSSIHLIVEPGRSIIGNSACLLTRTILTKTSTKTRFIVVDAAMTEVIRPCLYSAYHRIELIEPSRELDTTPLVFDVVGPVCESADFLGKNRLLRKPHGGCGLAVFDVGAYCSCMSSNYNMRLRPAEVLVDGATWQVIRKPDDIVSLLSSYNV